MVEAGQRDLIERTRVMIYASFAETGRAATISAIAVATGSSLGSIRQAFLALHASRDIVLSPSARGKLTTTSKGDHGDDSSASATDADTDSDPGIIAMAHPFSSVPLGFSVMGRDVLWWGGCAWDSFALAHLIPHQGPMLVATTCPNCDTPHAFNITASHPPLVPLSQDQDAYGGRTPVAHFLTPTSAMWDDVVHTCAHQRIFCAEACVDQWLARTGNVKGYIMDLGQLWRFAQGWYAGRLEYGYKRQEPVAAKEYFRSVGLSGAFWGL